MSGKWVEPWSAAGEKARMMLSKRYPVVAVTGATGLLGRYVVAELRHAGVQVRAVVRSERKAGPLAGTQVEIKRATLDDVPALMEAFDGASAVVHCAGLYKIGGVSSQRFFETNVEGTENVFAAMRATQTKRIVHISTWGVYQMRRGYPLTETSPRIDKDAYSPWPYRKTKAAAEHIAERAREEDGVDVTVIRPSGIYGAGDTMMLPRLRHMLAWPLRLPAPNLAMPIVYAGDCAEAVVAALHSDVASNRDYNVGGSNLPFSMFVDAVAQAYGLEHNRPWPFPFPLHFRLDSSRAALELGFSNVDYLTGLQQTLATEAAFAAQLGAS